MKCFLFSCLALISLLLISCDLGPESTRGFSLPKGNVGQGKTVLIKYQCLACHKLAGIQQEDGIDNPELSIRLGGKTTRIKTYAELVTSIINPSHKFAKAYPLKTVTDKGESRMKSFNDVMTVTELVDLVSFLQPHYQLVPYHRTNYQFYSYQ